MEDQRNGRKEGEGRERERDKMKGVITVGMVGSLKQFYTLLSKRFKNPG